MSDLPHAIRPADSPPPALISMVTKVARHLSADSPARLFELAAEELARGLEADQVSLLALDIVKRQITLFAKSGPGAEGIHPPPLGEILEDVSRFWAPSLQQLGANTQIIALERSSYFSIKEGRPQLTLPLRYQERVNGLLVITKTPGAPPFSDAVLDLCLSVASMLATAVEQHRLQQAERQQRRQAEVLRELSRILTMRLQRQEVLDLILDQLGRVLEYDSASIMLLENRQLKLVASRKTQWRFENARHFPFEQLSHLREVIEKRTPVIISDVHSDPRWVQPPGAEHIRSWMGIPLIEKNLVIGLINLDKNQPGFYSQVDANLALTFANQAAMAIENARLYDLERHQAEQLDALRATVADISSELELPRLLEAILQRAADLVQATGGDIGLFHEDRGEIEILVSHNLGKDYTGTRMRIGEGAMGRAIETRQPVIVEDYAIWNNASSQYRECPAHAVLAIPLIFANRIVGAIGLTHSQPEQRFSPFDQHILTLFGQHAAIAIENARLFEEARRAADRRAILHQISQQIVTANLDPEGIYQAIHRAAAQLMPAEAFVITKINETTRMTDAVYLVDRSGRVPPVSVPLDEGLSGMVTSTGKSIYIADLMQDQAGDRYVHFGDAEEVRSVVAVPMYLSGKVVGMISSQCYRPHAYSSDDIALLEMLASYAAIALDNARLLQEIQMLAITDPLTQVANRRQLFELGQREFTRARRFERPLAVIMLDIDHFKLVNDQYGHSTGDRILYELAQLLKQNVREADVVGRYGGEEFCLVLIETNLHTAYEVASRIRSSIHEKCCNREPGLPTITVSMGVAELTAEVNSFTDLLKNADVALYQAKERGRDRVELFHTINMASPNE